MSKDKVIELIFNNDLTEIEFLVHFLMKKGLSNVKIEKIFDELFKSDIIKIKKRTISIKYSPLAS